MVNKNTFAPYTFVPYTFTPNALAGDQEEVEMAIPCPYRPKRVEQANAYRNRADECKKEELDS